MPPMTTRLVTTVQNAPLFLVVFQALVGQGVFALRTLC